MAYNTDHLRTAGKITVYTAFVGVLVFTLAFIFNIGAKEITKVDAQSSATTTVTVVNTPPLWTASSTELIESSATNPTNAGDIVSWVAVGTDSNAERYYLLICDTSATPATSTNGNPPSCSSGVQWAVSASTTSGQLATAATTTLHSWVETNNWYAWICDTNALASRCSTQYTQGTNATNTSPFIVNHRPKFDFFWDNSPAEPGQLVTFTSTSSDSDAVGTQDNVRLIVCATAGFSTTTDSCTGTTLATTTVPVLSDATAAYTIVIPTQDQDYGAFGYVIDSHGFEATTTQGADSTLTVSNTAPTVSGATISLVQPLVTDMILSVEAGETTGFSLSFVSSDNNSCDSVASTTIVGDEVIDYDLSIYRNGIGDITSSSTTCPVTGPYNANNCYPSSVQGTAWNLTCTASTTTCSGSADTDMTWNCTFPLWYVADPTDGIASTTKYSSNDWRAQVRPIDDGQEGDLISLTGPVAESDTGVNVNSLLAFALNTLSIPYGSLEPGQKTDPIVATTTISSTGNVGLDKDVTGEAMCTTYSGSNLCPQSASSTIPENEQVFGTSTVTYAQGTPLSSTTPKVIQINVPKSTATSSQASSNAYWGIRIPETISYAGSYTGENTFTAILSNSSEW